MSSAFMGHLSVKIIGCGDAFGSGGQLNTCFYLRSSSMKILIDCGATSLPALRKYDVPIDEIQIIIITHFHGDHFGGLPYLLLYLSIYGQKSPLQIISPPNCREKVKDLLSLLYSGSKVLEKLDIEFISYESHQTIQLAELDLETFPMIHTPEADPHGIRVQLEGKSISYTGDTGWTDDLIPLAEDSDLFICECSFYKREIKGHLNYHTLKKNLNRLKFRKILLTHFDTEMLDNLNHLDLDYAREGDEIEV